MKRTKIKAVLNTAAFGDEVLVKGWVRTKRESKNVVFIALNDGSVISNLQIVLDPSIFEAQIFPKISTGACISVKGKLVESQGQGQKVELNAEEVEILGTADP